MVRIAKYAERKTEEGKSFFVLEVEGGLEMVKSKTTGKLYATCNKAFIPTTFSEDMCKALVGNELEGSIVKEVCEPYEYVVPETGEVMILEHRYVYTDQETKAIEIPDLSEEYANTSDLKEPFTPNVLEPVQ